MSIGIFVFVSLLLAPLIWGVTIYNQLVYLKNAVKQAWSNIDVLLKQRHSELPKLIEVCKQHMDYEQETLHKVIQARNLVGAALQNQDLAQLAGAEAMLSKGLNALFAVSENYPELKASESFKRLQVRITALEESIADRREFYNDSATIHNTRIEQFPDNIIASMFNFEAFDLLQFSEASLADVDVGSVFNS